MTYYGDIMSFRAGSVQQTVQTKTVYVYYHYIDTSDRSTVSPDPICNGSACQYPTYGEVEVDYQLAPSGKYSSTMVQPSTTTRTRPGTIMEQQER